MMKADVEIMLIIACLKSNVCIGLSLYHLAAFTCFEAISVRQFSFVIVTRVFRSSEVCT